MAEKQLYRAFQAWPLLTYAATHHHLLTYEELGEHLGMMSVSVGPIALEPISRYCEEKGLPRLYLIVVDKRDGIPKCDVGNLNVASEQAKVYAYDWVDKEKHARGVPTIADFERVMAAAA